MFHEEIVGNRGIYYYARDRQVTGKQFRPTFS